MGPLVPLFRVRLSAATIHRRDTGYVVLDSPKEKVIKPDLYEPELSAVFAAMLAH